MALRRAAVLRAVALRVAVLVHEVDLWIESNVQRRFSRRRRPHTGHCRRP